MTDRAIRAALAMAASFGILLALFGAAGALAQETVYDRLQPLFQVHGKICKPVTGAAMMVWKAERKGVLRREWMSGIARSIGKQAELAVVGELDLDEPEAEALADRLAMRDFMGEMVDRIYRPENYQGAEVLQIFRNESFPQSGAFCDWMADQCSQMVAQVLLDAEYSEEAHRVRFALNRWRSSARASLDAARADLEAARAESHLSEREIYDVVLISEFYDPYRKCYDRLGDWPSGSSLGEPVALTLPPVADREKDGQEERP